MTDEVVGVVESPCNDGSVPPAAGLLQCDARPYCIAMGSIPRSLLRLCSPTKEGIQNGFLNALLTGMISLFDAQQRLTLACRTLLRVIYRYSCKKSAKTAIFVTKSVGDVNIKLP
jgi:hypothetical protein